ncbi:MAG: ribosome-associated translation inhibitor RaiA [Ardenticatenales bacterium]|nr:ribosome-associated translation inhibitor RaiA [Ardenticatenales bacterium]
MELAIKTRNLKLTPRLQSYVENKTGRLDRYMPNLAEVRVDLSQFQTRSVNDRQVAQITIRDTRGTVLRAEERSNDMFAAVDSVIDKLYRQIKRYRGKRRDRRRESAEVFVDLEPVPIEVDEDEVSDGREVVRRKQFEVRPMSLDEAVEQMELLDHDFYVFVNADAGAAVNVLYRRRDGDYGLLEPEFK